MKHHSNHRDRKNPYSAEAYAKLRHEINALRGIQVYIPETKEYRRVK